MLQIMFPSLLTSLFFIDLCIFFSTRFHSSWVPSMMTAMAKLTLIPILLMLMLLRLLMMTTSTMTIISYCHVTLIPKIPYIVILYTPERWDTLFRSLFRFVFIFLVCLCVLNVYQSDHMLLSDGLGWAGMNEATSEQMDGFNELSLNMMGRATHKQI